jgi:hypothetical protein
MRRFSTLGTMAAVAGLAFAAPAGGQVATVVTTAVTFVTVDSVFAYASTLRITGIVQGESSPTEHEVTFLSASDTAASMTQAASCQRLALLAMERPGAYLYKLRKEYPSSGYYSCRLTRVDP